MPTAGGTIVYPGVTGGTNWWPTSFSEELGLLFVAVRENGSIYYRDPELYAESGQYLGGRSQDVPGQQPNLAVVALELASGRIRWKTDAPEQAHQSMGGLLSVGGQLVFGGQSQTFFALDARTGRRVWQANLGGAIQGPPIAWVKGDSVYLAVTAGSVLFVFQAPPP